MENAIKNYRPLVMIVYKNFDGSYKTYAIEKRLLKNFVKDVNENKVVPIPSEDVVLVTRNIVDFIEPDTEIEKLVYSQDKDTRNRLLETDAIKQAKVKPEPIEFIASRVERYKKTCKHK